MRARTLLAISLLVSACGGAPAVPAETPVVTVPPADRSDPGPIPVTREDPTLGGPDAVVTAVIFGDLEDPFFAGALERLRGLAAGLGAGTLRVTVKHLPMPWHPRAREAALAAAAVQEAAGPDAFFRFQALYADAVAQKAAVSFEDLGVRAGAPREALRRALTGPGPARKVAEDAALAAALKVTRSPTIFVDGMDCSAGTSCAWVDDGKGRLRATIEAEAEKARAVLAGGTPRADLYAARTAQNLSHPEPPPPPATTDTFGARHLLVQYQGAMRAGPAITRTKAEARARVEEALSKARHGAPFVDLVDEYSDEPGAKSRGGDLGSFRRGQMVPEFQAAVEKLHVGELSGVVETSFGFHLVLRTK